MAYVRPIWGRGRITGGGSCVEAQSKTLHRPAAGLWSAGAQERIYIGDKLISDVSEYDRWLRQARSTLLSAGRDREAGDYNWSCFKAQQAAEFALKGLLYGIGVSAVGHSLLRLLGDLERRGVEVDEVKGCSRILDRHYIPARYPNAHAEGAPFEFYDASTAEEAIECARRMIGFVEKVAQRV